MSTSKNIFINNMAHQQLRKRTRSSSLFNNDIKSIPTLLTNKSIKTKCKFIIIIIINEYY